MRRGRSQAVWNFRIKIHSPPSSSDRLCIFHVYLGFPWILSLPDSLQLSVPLPAPCICLRACDLLSFLFLLFVAYYFTASNHQTHVLLIRKNAVLRTQERNSLSSADLSSRALFQVLKFWSSKVLKVFLTVVVELIENWLLN